jgi:hypothetical protein
MSLMLRILDDMPAGVLGVEATAKLTSGDYTDVLRPALQAISDNGEKIRIVLVFPDESFGGMEPSAMWQDVKLGLYDWKAWERIALVTDIDWMRQGLRLFAWAVPGAVKDFPISERAAAVAWAAGS